MNDILEAVFFFFKYKIMDIPKLEKSNYNLEGAVPSPVTKQLLLLFNNVICIIFCLGFLLSNLLVFIYWWSHFRLVEFKIVVIIFSLVPCAASENVIILLFLLFYACEDYVLALMSIETDVLT